MSVGVGFGGWCCRPVVKVGGERNGVGKWEGDGGGEDGDEKIGGWGWRRESRSRNRRGG